MNNCYCQLAHYSFCDFKPHYPFKIDKTQLDFFDDTKEYFTYIEEYQNFDLVKLRISELNLEWEKNKNCSQYEYDNLMISLYNRWGKSVFIGIYNSNKEWYVSGLSGCTLESVEKQKKAKNDISLRGKIIEFYMPIEIVCFWDEMVTRQSATQILQEWLDTGSYTEYFLNDLGEIKTRRYPYDLETKKEIEKQRNNIDDDLSSIPW